MIVKEKIFRNIGLTCFGKGLRKYCENEIKYVKENNNFPIKYKNVLIIGCSTGYGLSSRVVTSFGMNANTLGVSFEREPSENKLGTLGYYNNKVLEEHAKKDNLYFETINGDAFSNEVKNKVVDIIKRYMGKIDLVIYSIASPKRIDPITKEVYVSSLKPVLKKHSTLDINQKTNKLEIKEFEIATDKEINDTVKVMGGEDFKLWMQILKDNDCLNNNVRALAYSYIGPKLTYPIYRTGTIGIAKQDLENSIKDIDNLLKDIDGKSYVSVNKAIVTRASSVIPGFSLYISLLNKVEKKHGFFEDSIKQMVRLFSAKLPNEITDQNGRLRLDDIEMLPIIQKEVTELWDNLNEGDYFDLSDYNKQYSNIHGFGYDDIDYLKDVDPRDY